jgi:hypothetical protein
MSFRGFKLGYFPSGNFLFPWGERASPVSLRPEFRPRAPFGVSTLVELGEISGYSKLNYQLAGTTRDDLVRLVLESARKSV